MADSDVCLTPLEPYQAHMNAAGLARPGDVGFGSRVWIVATPWKASFLTLVRGNRKPPCRRRGRNLN
jgi:hypothetical protein